MPEDETPDPDKAPPPKPFERPKHLLDLAPEPDAPVEVKSGAAKGVAPPFAAKPPKGADVRTLRPSPSPKVRPEFVSPPGEVHIDAPKPRTPIPTKAALDMGEVEIQQPRPTARRPSPDRAVRRGPVEVVSDSTARAPLTRRLRVTKPRKLIGIVDTTFARYNMGQAAHDQLKTLAGEYDVLRRTVPGIKDIAVECKILFEEEDADLVIACGMVGKMPIDKACAHEASLAIQWTMLQTNRHILEVFVHEDEAQDEKQLAWLMDQRTREHAENAHWMVLDPDRLRANAGQGLRQGFPDAGPIARP